MDSAPSFSSLLQAEGLARVMQRFHSLRAAHWDALARVLLCVRPEHFDPSGTLRWDALSLAKLEEPLTREDLRAWLATKPPRAALSYLAYLFDPRDDRSVSWRELFDDAREVYPEALPALLPSPGQDPFDRERTEYAGEAWALALVAQKRAFPDSNHSHHFGAASTAQRAVYLQGSLEHLGGYELSELGRQLHRTEDLTEEARRAYSKACVALAARLSKRDADTFYPYTPLLDEASLEALLRGPHKNVAVGERLMLLTAAQGSTQGAAALASALEDKKLGAYAALCLASMGERGRAAVRARRDGASWKSPAAKALATALLELPDAPGSLWDGGWFSLPRFGRTHEQDLLPAARWPEVPAHAPTPLASLEALVKERPARDLLPPEGWADVLQLLVLDPHLLDLPGTYARALHLRRLGHGKHRDALVAALDELRWSADLRQQGSTHSLGVGWVLLWADAGPEVFRHAVGRHGVACVASVLGSRTKHFFEPLTQSTPPWAAPLCALLWFRDAHIHENAWQGRPRRFAAAETPAPELALPVTGTDLWLETTVEKAARVTVELRGTVRVVVQPDAQRWEVRTPTVTAGATPPRSQGSPLRISVETARDGMYVGVDGAMVHGPFTGLPGTFGEVRVVAEGEGAQVLRLELFEKRTVRESEAVGTLLSKPDAPQGYAEIAGQRSPAAALLLGTIARLGDAARAKLAADALATMTDAHLEPWTRAPVREPEPVTEPAAPKGRKKKTEEPAPETPLVELPAHFVERSYEDVVRTFQDLKLGVKARSKKPAELTRGQAQYNELEFATFGPSGATEDWGARTAVPWPAVYLTQNEPYFEEPRDLMDALARLPALCRKGRGTQGSGSYCHRPGEFLVASVDVSPPDDGYGDWNLWTVFVAAWKVSEGWAWGLTATSLEDLARLVGLRAFPAQVEWKSFRGLAIGNW